MTTKRKLLTGTAALGITLLAAACTPAQVAGVLNARHPAGDVVTVTEAQVEAHQVPNVSPPQRLDVAMTGLGSDVIRRCRDMGGEPIQYPHPVDVIVCEGVDY
jgi:hypothetical protein